MSTEIPQSPQSALPNSHDSEARSGLLTLLGWFVSDRGDVAWLLKMMGYGLLLLTAWSIRCLVVDVRSGGWVSLLVAMDILWITLNVLLVQHALGRTYRWDQRTRQIARGYRVTAPPEKP